MAINIFTHIRRGLYDNVYNCIEKEKVDVNQRDDDTGNPPLVVAVEENQIEIVRLLLNHGADVNCKDWTSKNTALDVAEQKGFKPIAEVLQQGLIFDNKEACQLWADKLKVAYALKQRIVESESQDEYLEKCVIWFSYDKKQYAYEWKIQDIDMSLIVSTNAKDILMADDVSDEDFKAFIEVFSL